jgi:hypothetical protein
VVNEPDHPVGPLDDYVRALVRKVIEDQEFDGKNELLAQVPYLHVVDGPLTFLNLTVVAGAGVESPFAGEVVPGQAWVIDRAGRTLGTLLVWVFGGCISALEYGWVTDDPPDALPTLDQVSTRS